MTDAVAETVLIGRRELVAMGITYSREHLWRLIKRGSFPAPLKFGGRTGRAYWRRDTIEQFIKTIDPLGQHVGNNLQISKTSLCIKR